MHYYTVTLLEGDVEGGFDPSKDEGDRTYVRKDKHRIIAESEDKAIQAAMRRARALSRVWGFNVQVGSSL